MWAPATWSRYQIGQTQTWVHPGTAKRSRNDYIAISDTLHCTDCCTWVAEESDIATSREDHSAVALSFAFQTSGSLPSRRQRKQRDREQMAYQLTAPTGVSILPNIHTGLDAPWSLGVHEHYVKLSGHVNEKLCQPFCKTKKQLKQPIKTHLTSETWDVICAKQKARIQMKHTARVGDPLLLKMCFGAWQGHSHAEILWQELRNIRYDHALAWSKFRCCRAVTKAVRIDVMQRSLNSWRREPTTLMSPETAGPLGKISDVFYHGTDYDAKSNLYNFSLFRTSGSHIFVSLRQVSARLSLL